MNVYALYKIIVVYPLNISLSSDKINVLKTSSIEDRGRLISEAIGISRNFCYVHPLQTDIMIVFDNLIWHPYYRRIKSYAVLTLDFVFFSLNLENWTYSTHYFSHALLPNLYLFDSESA